MADYDQRLGRDFIVRHGETVFNAARRLQGDILHTPLTRAGIAQANSIGASLQRRLGRKPELAVWVSPSGRTLQTLAIISEYLELDWDAAIIEPCLAEIGMGEWTGRLYADVISELSAIDCNVANIAEALMFAPYGETYGQVSKRMNRWVMSTNSDRTDRLVVTHGLSSRVLRGQITNMNIDLTFGVPFDSEVHQGAIVTIEKGIAEID